MGSIQPSTCTHPKLGMHPPGMIIWGKTFRSQTLTFQLFLMALIVNRKGSYVKNGNPVFTGIVTSNTSDSAAAQAELDDYKTSKGSFYREDEDGNPIYFSSTLFQSGSELVKTQRGQFTILRDLESEVLAVESFKNQQTGKIEAIRQYTGMSRAQMQQALLDSLK